LSACPKEVKGAPAYRLSSRLDPEAGPFGPWPRGSARCVAAFAKAEGFSIVGEFTEVETGKGSDALDRRPELKAALKAAKKLKCQVAVASSTG
jgi:DNA invertase Pin-like site-specific DNA recombinase